MRKKRYIKMCKKVDIDDIKEKLQEILNKGRYKHTIGVCYTAMSLAMCYGEDIKKAELAGLLHDNAKCISDEKMLKKCRKHNIEISDAESRQPYLLHAKLGAFYASYKYGVDDNDVAEAIRYHTTGCPDMSMLQKIIYVADYIEPGRDKAENLSEIRKMAFNDIDKAVYMILRDTISYLEDNNKVIDDVSLRTYEFYCNMLRNED